MPTTHPAVIERQFRADGVPGQDDYVMRIVIKPGRVMLLDGARHKGLTWYQAERYAAEILEASRAARILSELSEDRLRFHHPDELDLPCAKCGLAIREGVVTTPTEGGGRRHVIGSPECGR